MASVSARLVQWGPLAVVIALFLALAVVSPETLAVTAKNPLAWAFIALVAVVSIGLNWLVGRRWRRPALGRAVGLVPIVIALVWGFLPAFRDVEVIDAAPEGLPAAAATASSTGASSTGATSAPPTTTSSSASSSASPAPPPTSQPPPPTTAVPPPVAEPIDLGSAGLVSLDYQASGTARLIQLTAAELLVRFESLDVENGPDYVVYLVPGADQRAPGNGVFLGELRGNQGDQNYDVPAGTAAEGTQTILIWCRSFAAPVANATVG